MLSEIFQAFDVLIFNVFLKILGHFISRLSRLLLIQYQGEDCRLGSFPQDNCQHTSGGENHRRSQLILQQQSLKYFTLHVINLE